MLMRQSQEKSDGGFWRQLGLIHPKKPVKPLSPQLAPPRERVSSIEPRMSKNNTREKYTTQKGIPVKMET